LPPAIPPAHAFDLRFPDSPFLAIPTDLNRAAKPRPRSSRRQARWRDEHHDRHRGPPRGEISNAARTAAGFEALKQDIAERGVLVAVVVDEFGAILDGHNRARACRELGINDYPVEVRSGLSETDKRVLARKLNVLRRHLSREQVRQLIADQLQETPDWANRRIGRELGVDHKTVAAARVALGATGEIPQFEKTTGKDGKARPARRNSRPKAADDWDDDWNDDEPQRRRRPNSFDDPAKQAKFSHAVDLIKLGVDPNSEQVSKLIREASFCVIGSPPGSYDPLAGRSDEERREWHVFMLFLVQEHGCPPQGASMHIEWVLQRPFQNIAEWLGEAGDKFRKQLTIKALPEATKESWRRFLARENRPLPELIAALEQKQREIEA
jgi:hypothetical protein